MIAALVPVKALSASKSRLRGEGLDPVETLSLAMMGDVVEALLQVDGLASVSVVTPDARVACEARRAGARVWLRDDAGLNPAVEAAAAALAPAPGDGALVVLGDVAAADPAELAALVASLEGAPGVALAPSRDGGTSALLRVPRDAIPARFGPDSARRHREAAREAGVRLVERPLPSLAIDVDVREDAHDILACETLGRRTRAVLAARGAEAR